MPRTGKPCACLHTPHISLVFILMTLTWLCQSLSPASASQVSENDTIKLYAQDNLYYVKVDTRDSIVKGIIDTAATIPLFDARALRKQRTDLKHKPARTVLGSNGVRTFEVVEVPDIRIGNHMLTDLSVVVTRLRHTRAYQAIIPSNSFGGAVIDLDFPNRVLRTPAHPLADNPTYTIQKLDCLDHASLLVIDISINGVPGKAILDTGAEFSYVNTAFVKRAHLQPRRQNQMFITGLGQETEKLYTTRAASFKLGDFVHHRVELMIADIALFDRLKLASEPAMVLGMDLLKKYRVQIDRRNKQVRLLKPVKR